MEQILIINIIKFEDPPTFSLITLCNGRCRTIFFDDFFVERRLFMPLPYWISLFIRFLRRDDEYIKSIIITQRVLLL